MYVKHSERNKIIPLLLDNLWAKSAREVKFCMVIV